VLFLKQFGIPVSRICGAFSLSRATLYRFLNSHSSRDPISQRILELAHEFPAYGYRRIHALLQREGFSVNHKKVFRLYSRLSLQKEVKCSRKLAHRNRGPLTAPQFPGHVWSADFVELMVRRRKLRLLFVIDDFTRLVVGVFVGFSIPAFQVQAVLQRSISRFSRPRVFRTDNGSEFRQTQLNRFLSNSRIKHEFIPKGKPYQNGFSESFNAHLKEECLQTFDIDLFPISSIQEAVLYWVKEYNEFRPHSALGYQSPVRFHLVRY